MKVLLTVFFALTLYSTNAQRIAPDTIALAKGSLVIQPIQHASMVLTAGGKTIYVDPVGGGAKYQGLAAPDIILVTDIHGDHFDPATLGDLVKAGVVLVVPEAVAVKLESFPKGGNVVVLHNGGQANEGGILIDAIPMYNLPASATDPRHPKGRGNGYVLSVGGKKIYLSGDTQGIPEMRALTGIDIAFVCMNLPYTMDVKEAADAVLAFKPRIVYPYHYRGQSGFSDVAAFKATVEAGNKNIEVRQRNWYPG
ncbi:MAG TPA: MBL fold metallo-hydrolase [Puia sp.]|jgi:L-ascorbate metabolism protein UlaG (beta-lactamase superfamily)|nr:MBL fold metallo-hydrolase [Puia sp.]